MSVCIMLTINNNDIATIMLIAIVFTACQLCVVRHHAFMERSLPMREMRIGKTGLLCTSSPFHHVYYTTFNIALPPVKFIRCSHR